MKNFFKNKKVEIVLLSVIFAVAMIFSFSACKSTDLIKKISGEVTADANGEIKFMYSRTSTNNPATCSFTTNLPSPNDKFDLTLESGSLTFTKTINGLNAGQKVKWTATAEGNPLNHGSGNFVHIIND